MKQIQPILGKRGTLFFLVIISAFPPLTMDLYLPALPTMVEVLQTNQAMVNLTLSAYFITYAIGLLFWGPLSEKFGRKAILLTGIFIYVTASLCCGFSSSVEHLILFRVFQAFGGSAITVVATAVIKDLYDGREREKIMATIMSLVIIAPMVAPVLGAFLLKVASWHMMFFTLAIFGMFSALFALCYSETLPSRYTGSILRSWGRLGVVLKHRKFVFLLAIFCIVPMALMAFLAAGSYIYINHFNLTEQEFSYAFAFNAFFASFGPVIYIKLSKVISVQRVITMCFLILLIVGFITFTYGMSSPWLFAGLAAPATLAVIMMRIPGTNLMLDQHDTDTGSVVAIIQFSSMVFGALGMTIVSLYPEALIESLGVIQFSIGLLGGIGWLLIKKRDFVADKLVKI
ncbi:Bcr/CflA family efflux MFS transporter [Psychromonas aquatilis]|uniref:Bcr/CflA family efflux transporter n=1 Tax=Psychromonas aquatilis TaxID=2005072 RepID=A0ABU9GRM6_9GAMM